MDLTLRQLLCALALVLPNLGAGNERPDVAFFYGSAPPVSSLSQYDWVVLDADNAGAASVRALAERTRVHCYLSVGEATAERAAAHADSILGDNPGWGSKVMDLTASRWQAALVEQARRLQGLGCEGLFLDTLDSYQLVTPEARWADKQAALTRIVEALAEATSKRPILLNRGFEVIGALAPLVSGLVTEGLYEGWDAANGRYRSVTDSDRNWLMKRLEAARALGKPVIVIDYQPPGTPRDAMAALAARIETHGYIPWVTDVGLQHLGSGRFTPEPREVAVVYSEGSGDWAGHDAHTLLGPVLDYYGLNARPYDVSTALPQLVKGHHAGMIVWLDNLSQAALGDADAWAALLREAEQHDIPFALFGVPPQGFEQLLPALQLRTAPDSDDDALLLNTTSGYGNFEAKPRRRAKVGTPLTNSGVRNLPWLTLNLEGNTVAPVLTGPWGGYAQHPFILDEGFRKQRRWLLDPFAFLSKALKIDPRPVPDVTTENGERILLAHVDGDGFPSRAELPGTPYSAEVLLEQVFRAIDLPHTVSVVEGEVGPSGLFPYLTHELEPLAREIFALPNVEIASHTYSHPFFWARRDRVDVSKTLYGLGLPIAGYSMQPEREIIGSADYIDARLAPPGKRTRVLLWSGDAVPAAAHIRLTRERGLANLNGGNTQIRNALPSLTNVSPHTRWTEGGYQNYAPVMNENVYTNDWTGPFDGFRRVVETFERTNAPRRLKAMNLYYHFYSGTKQSALTALLEVYSYLLAQPHLALYVSEYAQRLAGFHSARLRRTGEHTWEVDELGSLRTVRLPTALGLPDLARSSGVAGWRDGPDGRYLHLTGDHARIVLGGSAQQTHLAAANVPLARWHHAGGRRYQVVFSGYAPVRFDVGGSAPCKLALQDGTVVTPERQGGLQRYALQSRRTGEMTLRCGL